MKKIIYQLNSDGSLSVNGIPDVCYAGEHNATELIILFSGNKYQDYEFMLQFHTPDCQSPRFSATVTENTVISLPLPAVVMQTGEVGFDLEAIGDRDDAGAQLIKLAQGKFTVEPAITNGKLYNDKYYDEIYLLELEYLKLKNNLMKMIDSYLKEKYDQLDGEAQALRASLEAQINTFISSATAKIKAMETDIEHCITNADIDIKALIAQVNDKMNRKYTEFDRFLTNADIDVKALIAQASDKLQKLLSDAEAELDELTAALPEQINAKIKEFCAVSKLAGTADDPVIISSLPSGIYKIEGCYKAKENYMPLFYEGTPSALIFVGSGYWYEFNGARWSRWTWISDTAVQRSMAVCEASVDIDSSVGRISYADYTPKNDSDIVTKKALDSVVGDINNVLAGLVNGGESDAENG